MVEKKLQKQILSTLQYSKARYEGLQEQLDKLQHDLAFDIAGLKKQKGSKNDLRQSFDKILSNKSSVDHDSLLKKIDQLKKDHDKLKSDVMKQDRL